MKTRLEELTTAQFMELVCGNKKTLLDKREIPNPFKLTIAMRNIVMEYRAIADPGGNAAYLQRIDALIKSRLAVAVYSMCQNLVVMQRYDDAREILIAAGHNAAKWNEKRIESEVHIQLQKARRAVNEIDDDEDGIEVDKDSIRNSFNELIAAMMAHFKFQIDIGTMMAPVFAHLTARYHAEVKAMRKAMKH